MKLALQEQANVRAALHYLHARVGTWVTLAKVLRSKRATIRRIRAGYRVRPYMARKIAALAGVSVADLLAGAFPPAGVCHRCGCSIERVAAAQ